MTTKKKTSRGRPKGTQTTVLPVVEAAHSQCRACGSTDREPYTNQRTREIGGVHPTFGVYTAVRWARTKCTQCGQARFDKIYLRPSPAAGAGK